MPTKVRVIPATINPATKVKQSEIQRRRVCAYARVSTDSDEQFTSYEAQIDYYTRYITSRADWSFVKVYTDEGISGTSTRLRTGFNEMIADALNGEIDLIVTKSVSRFARNTVDSLSTIRKLKENNVEVFFEKENIYTFDGKGELLLTIMSSLAQEESRSISENVTWGIRKKFADGKFDMPYKSFLGYEKGEDGPVINEEQAKIVRRIYSEFMSGKVPGAIAKDLTEDGILTVTGKTEWSSENIKKILTNEKYRGSARLQKEFTVDFLTKKQKKNEGEVPQYWVEKSHEPIIEPEEWDAVQDELERRKELKGSYRCSNILSSKLICEDCGSYFGSKVWHSTDKYRTEIFQCNNKFKNKVKCCTPHLREEDVKDRFVAVMNKIIENREEYIDVLKMINSRLCDTTGLDGQIDELSKKMQEINREADKCISSSFKTSTNITELSMRFDELNKEYRELTEQRKEMKRKKRKIERFIKELTERENLLTEFDTSLFLTTVENILVKRDGILVFNFFDGMRIEG